jgi:hypothetical protein
VTELGRAEFREWRTDSRQIGAYRWLVASGISSLPRGGVGGTDSVSGSFRGNARVRRGDESWAYIYVALGFALSIEGTIVQMLFFERPWNAVLYLALMVGTVRLFVFSGQFQDWLFGLKERVENMPR